MLKRSLLFLLLAGTLSLTYAQETGASDPAEIGADTAQQALRTISVTKFEDAAFWYPIMDMEAGRVSLRRFDGSPVDKEPIEGETEAGVTEPDVYVLGAKVEFIKRSKSSFTIRPLRPIPIPGIVKTISIWVVGRNFNHRLNVEFEDHFGRRSTLPLGKLNFSGWKQLTVAIPPRIEQQNIHYNNVSGIKIIGLRVDCNLDDSYGTYYIYFDDMRVITDLFSEESRDEDDMMDTW